MDEVRPQMKHTSPTFVMGGVLYIGGFGEVTEVQDPEGMVHRLCSLMDGTRTIEELYKNLVVDFPGVTEADVKQAIRQFDDAGFLQNGAVVPDGLLDSYDLQRWERNVNFFGSYATLSTNKYLYQHRLKTCRLTLLGLGGLGTHILMDAAAMGIGHVKAVEFDKVELSNLNRQILYTDADIGRPKAEVAVERVTAFNPRIEIETIQARISSTEDVLEVVNGADVVISVADRPKMEIMHWVNEGCVRTGVPLITGGLETQRAIYYTMLPGETGCVECWRRHVFNTDPVSAALLQEKRKRQIGGDNAAFCPLVTMTTGFLLGELVRLVTGLAPPVAAGRLMQLRFDDYTLSEAERWERLPDCPVCGHLPPSLVAERSSIEVAPASI
jgi:molybdopterin/thiamine biosynthesis adenylyltransferase